MKFSMLAGASLAAFLALALSATAAEPLSKTQVDFFENRVRPILNDKCYKCHSAQSDKVKGGLLVDSRDGLLKGGNTGPAIVPGNPEKSLLIKAVSYSDPDLQMPPKGEKLSASQIADLTQWVKMGAPDPRTAPVAGGKSWAGAGKTFWSFQPVKKPAVPAADNKEFVKSPIDNFIVAKLDEKNMKPNAPADKRTLLRRATFDLIGLPPTPEEVKSFLEDNSDTAFEKVVDRLIRSPQFGERWARHWLDTARYSDTKGEVKRKREDPLLPYAWTYRDYVIDAFNTDKSYDRFILEQIAADKLPLGKDRGPLAALGFLTIGERFMGNQNDIINDRIDVVTKGLLGLTVSCARCHDHKFDPIPTKDYYSLRGVFLSSAEAAEAPLLKAPARTPEALDFQKKYNDLHAELDAMLKKGMPKGKDGKQALFNKVELETRISKLELTHPGAPPRAHIMQDKPKPEDSPIFIRGEAENKGEIAPRRFLEVLSGPNRQNFKLGSGRLELAQAIATKSNPLTARVFVNRVWLHLFGEGFVTSADDFGNQSAPPVHPELLDYLASNFMDGGWSMKKLIRSIMLSGAYQQGSQNNPRYAEIDPGNRLLWRANVRRLDFEALRDSILAIGGKLDPKMGGQPVNLLSEPYSERRTVYGVIDRANLPEMYNHFDFANPDMTNGKRYQTIVPQQSLFLMNSPLVVEQAKNLVARADFKSGKTDEARVKLLYELIYQRSPRPDEVKLGLQFLSESPTDDRAPALATPAMAAGKGKGKKVEELKKGGRLPTTTPIHKREPLNAWEKYAHVLLQANETSFIN